MDTISQSIVLTGGPGGGKSSLLHRLHAEPEWRSRIAVLEEAIHGMRFVRMPPDTAGFQCALVAIQAASETALTRALAGTGARWLVSHRGTLDPCAFWQAFGNSRESFFAMTGTSLADHYRRYALVIHLETAAVAVPEAYERYPVAHRPEDLEQACKLDSLLAELWQGHPNYVKLPGTAKIEHKLAVAMQQMTRLLG